MTQDVALKIIKTGANIFLTGEPGSGKTYTINGYISYLKNCGVAVSVTASTGIAATHIGGMTIHSWSGIGIKKYLSDYDVDRIANMEHIASRVRRTKVLIIDEISMLDSTTLSNVDRVVQEIKQSKEPFGGLQVLFVGDFFQLPPIVKREGQGDGVDNLFDEEELPFAFASSSWQAANPIVCYLSEQHRQSDDVYLEILTAIRTGTVDEKHREHLESRKVSAISGRVDKLTKLFPHNADVDRINTLELGKLKGEANTFSMISSGKDALVEQMKRGCLSPSELILKEGAIVMFTKNNFDKKFVNGTLGIVVGFDEDSGFPKVKTQSGDVVIAAPMEWAIEDNGKILARIAQVPLRLAWAITVHKSQGMSLDSAFMDLSGAFVAGQGYVALSRVKTLDGLHLAGYNHASLLVHEDVQEKDAFFRQASEEAQIGFESLSKEELHSMHTNFIRASGGDIKLAKVKRTAKEISETKKSGGSGPTLSLVKEGKSIAEIAHERMLTQGTIMKHLEDLKMSKSLSHKDIAHLAIGQEDVIHEIQKVLKKSKDEKLKPIFEKLGGEYSYEQIRLARLLLP